MALSPYQQLEQEFRRLHAFRSAASILRWDSAVMMPRGSSDLRGEQLAALETESHALLTSPRVSRLLDARGSEQRRPRGLAERQPARDAPRARSRDRHAAEPGVAARQGDGARRGQMGRGETEKRFRHLRAAPRGSGEPAARQGRSARQGAESRSVRRAGRRVQPGHDQRRDRRDLHDARTPPARPDPGSDRPAGAAPAAGNHRPLRAFQAAPARRRGDEGHRLPVRARPDRRERASVHRRRAGRHPHHHALQSDRSAHRPHGRAARDRSRDVRRRPAGSVARPAGRARSRHGDAGEPVAAAGDADRPQPAVPALPQAAAGQGVRRCRRPASARNGKWRTCTGC